MMHNNEDLQFNILALDSSGETVSAALSAKSASWYIEITAGQSHSELLLECACKLFETAGLTPADLDLVSCMKGPGSFTGLRIGFSTAKGIALALGVPLVSVPTLDCIAHRFSMWPGLVLPAIDAKKGCFFAAFYRHGKRLTDYQDSSPETLAKETARLIGCPDEPILLTGDGAELLYSPYLSFFSGGNIKVDPVCRRGSAKELLEILKNANFNGLNDINGGPLYLRKSDAELNFKVDGL